MLFGAFDRDITRAAEALGVHIQVGATCDLDDAILRIPAIDASKCSRNKQQD